MDIPTLIHSVKLSALAGGFKVFCQILVALLIFPKIIQDEGIAAVGSWVMLQIIIGYGGLVNLGMGAVLIKWNSKFTQSGKQSKEDIINCKTHDFFATSLTSGLVFFSIIFLLISILNDSLLSLLQDGIKTIIPFSTIWIMFVAMAMRFYSSLYGALVTSYHKNVYINIAQSSQLLIFILSFFFWPDEFNVIFRLSLSFFIGYLVEIFITITVLYFINNNLLMIPPNFSLSKSIDFYKEVLPFFMMDLALIGREPIIKYAAYLLGGSTYVGIFELATKIPYAIRQAYVVGLSALMPAFSSLSIKGSHNDMIHLGSSALLYVVYGSIASLIIYGLNAEFLLSLWLGIEIENLLLDSTLLLTIWWAISSYNVPAWWLGIGGGNVWFNALIAGIHFIISIELYLVAFYEYELTLLELILYWVIGGVLMQIFLYWLIEFKTGLIKKIYLTKKANFSLIYFLVLIAAIYFTGGNIYNYDLSSQVFFSISVFFVYLPLITYTLYMRFKYFDSQLENDT